MFKVVAFGPQYTYDNIGVTIGNFLGLMVYIADETFDKASVCVGVF